MNSDSQQVLLRLEKFVTFFTCSFLELTNSSLAASSSNEVNLYTARLPLLPSPATPRTVQSALRVVYLASLSYENIMSNRLTTKRDLYYICRPLFGNVAAVDRALTNLAEFVNVDPNDLHIVAAAKGLVAGPVSFVEESGCYVDVARFGSQGSFIPARPERMRSIESQAKGVLVFEKETVFRSVLSEPLTSQILAPYIIITGKGYPDVATRHFIKALSASRSNGEELRIFVLTDADPHGVHIASCYRLSLPCCPIVWLGVRPSDHEEIFTVDRDSLLALTQDEKEMIQSRLVEWSNIGRKRIHLVAPFVKAMHHFQTTGYKFEMEVLLAVRDDSGTSALLQYVTSRIAEWSM